MKNPNEYFDKYLIYKRNMNEMRENDRLRKKWDRIFIRSSIFGTLSIGALFVGDLIGVPDTALGITLSSLYMFVSMYTVSVLFSGMWQHYERPKILFSYTLKNIDPYDIKESQIGKGKLFERVDDEQIVINIRHLSERRTYFIIMAIFLIIFIPIAKGDNWSMGGNDVPDFTDYIILIVTFGAPAIVLIYAFIVFFAIRRVVLNRKDYTITIPGSRIFFKSKTIPFDQGIMTFESKGDERPDEIHGKYNGATSLIHPTFRPLTVITDFDTVQEGLELLKLMQEYMNDPELPNLEVFDKYIEEE